MKRDRTIVTQIYRVLEAHEIRPCGRCDCKHAQCTQEWDTLCIPLDGTETYKVHYPDLRASELGTEPGELPNTLHPPNG